MSNGDAAADSTDKLKTWEDGVLCVKTKAGPPSLGSARLTMADHWANLEEPASPETSAGVCCGVDGGRGKRSVGEDSGGSQWCRWPFHRVSQLLSAGGGAAASPTPRCSHRGQFKVSSIHLLLFHR